MMRSWRATLLATALAASSALADPSLVRTDLGVVRGILEHGVREYRGIPFALPPTGERRFRAPEPAIAWEGTLDATTHRGICPQPPRYGLGLTSEDEDCLYLNVAVPAAPARNHRARPVLVWIHGGVFVGGTASIYPLAHLARRGDLVVVSINYRLGALGFMAHPGFDAADNGAFGLEDQRLALRWVKRNIAAFGGDPHNVTIAGESAGGASVGFHLIAPEQTTGLFQKAIIQSAGFTARLKTVEEAAKTGLSVAEAVGCSDPATAADCLRKVPVDQLLAAQVAANKASLLAFVPAVGTKALPEPGSDALAAGRFVRVPLLNGGNEQEMRLFVGYDVAAGARITAANYPALIISTYGQAAPRVLDLYPLSNYSSPPAAAGSVFSDYLQSIPIGHCYFLKAATLAARRVPVFEYEFADAAAPPVEPNPGFEMGAVHSAELPYLFPHFSNNAALDGPDLAPKSQRLADQIVDLWSSFAHGGQPRASGLPRWPVYRGGRTVLRLAPGHSALFDAARAHHCAEWQQLFPDELSTTAPAQ